MLAGRLGTVEPLSWVHGLYVVVTVIGEMQAYMRAWPGVMIMALPDKEAVEEVREGRGRDRGRSGER